MTQRQEEQRQEQLKVAEAQSRQLQLEADSVQYRALARQPACVLVHVDRVFPQILHNRSSDGDLSCTNR